jgi:inorganic pyrophosphatase
MNVFIETLQGSDSRTRYDDTTLERGRTVKINSRYPYAYGFIIASNRGQEECIDCYVLTEEVLVEGEQVDCEPVFMLEVYEGSEEDHKVVMKTAGFDIEDEELVETTIKAFITRIFSTHPEVTIRFGRRIGREDTIDYINSHLRK